MNKKSQIGEIALLAAQKIVLASVGGFALWLIPILQNWVIYLIWGPLLGIVFVWAYWESREPIPEGFKSKATPIKAFIIGLVHVSAVTTVWFIIAKWTH